MGGPLGTGVGHGAGGQRPEWSSPWGTGSRTLERDPHPSVVPPPWALAPAERRKAKLEPGPGSWDS